MAQGAPTRQVVWLRERLAVESTDTYTPLHGGFGGGQARLQSAETERFDAA